MKIIFLLFVFGFSVVLFAQNIDTSAFSRDKWHAEQGTTHSYMTIKKESKPGVTYDSMIIENKLKTVIDTSSGKRMLIGIATREAFKDTSFSWWFDSEYEGYIVKMKELDGVREKIKDFSFAVVAGTWCSDSRREVPRFLKVLDSLEYPQDKVKLIMVDRKKKDLSGEVDSMKIELVPTIIFYKDGAEAGRITEAPKETLETDTNNIIFGRITDEKKE